MQKKRSLFFAIVAVLFVILFGLVMFHPILHWADTCGLTVLSIPMSQFLIWVSSFGLAILVTVLFYVDTKVLVDKKGGKQ